MSNLKFKFSNLHFIVSEENDRIQREVFETKIKVYSELNETECNYYLVNSKKDLIRVLTEILSQSNEIDNIPYIHLECHGGPEGIKLNSGARCSWKELTSFFSRINQKSGNNLFVSSAACYSGYLFTPLAESLSKVEPRAPFFGHVGPVQEISYDETEKGFEKYFEILLTTGDHDAAVEKLNEFALEPYVFSSCQKVFEILSDQFIENEVKEILSSRIRFITLLHTLVTVRSRRTAYLPTEKDYVEIERLMKNKSFYITFLNDTGISFFMIDLFPQNLHRFMLHEDLPKLNKILN